jgi:pimeloyl-ACP methyl ester carboxylesterase
MLPRWLAALALLLCLAVAAPAASKAKTRRMLDEVNARLCGHVVDHTHNHGADRRIWSAALGEKRDLYVYLPPGFDPTRSYPIVLDLHPFTHDEQYFLENEVEPYDRAICSGDLPPMIIAAPDGSIQGRPTFFRSASFFLNSDAGRFEDFLTEDVWNFLVTRYPIRPEREAHAVVGGSMGGFGAYHLALRHPDRFAHVAGLFPPLNLRWVDCHGNYRTKFDPCCWDWRERVGPCEVVGRFYGVVPVRFKRLTRPLYGHGPDVVARMSADNPIEMILRHPPQPSELGMFIGYGGKDELHVDAQVESFLYVARQLGLCATVVYDPQGKHDVKTGLKLFPAYARWLAPRLAPFAPPLTPTSCPPPSPRPTA